MIRVDSSSIESVGYDGGGNLYVKFKSQPASSGKFYTYCNVPRHVYLGLIGSKSTGRYFNENVKGKYSAFDEDQDPI